MTQHGILHKTSSVKTSSQTKVTKRNNKHLLEIVRGLLLQMQVPKRFQTDAISTSCCLINHISSSIFHGETPYHVLFPNKPLFPIKHRTFDCTCFVRDIRPPITKLNPKSLKCVFLEYSQVLKGLRCYSPNFNKYLVSTDVTFLETTPFFPSSDNPSQGEDDNLVFYF